MLIAGHWEGDLIMGSANRSAIGTVVERTTRYPLLLHLPDGHGAEHVRDALLDAVAPLPARLRRSLTWDQGVEMSRHDEFTQAAASGLLLRAGEPLAAGHQREHQRPAPPVLPQGHRSQRPHRAHLAGVAAELNARPRKTLGWETPSRSLDRLLVSGP